MKIIFIYSGNFNLWDLMKIEFMLSYLWVDGSTELGKSSEKVILFILYLMLCKVKFD